MPGRSLAALAAALVLALPATAPAQPEVDAYRGAGAWIDIYSREALAHPEAAVRRIAAEGATTLYLETANYHKPARGTIAHPGPTARLIEAAHAQDMAVVAWYLPGLADLARDRARTAAALALTTPSGEGFDGFAADIESTVIRSIPARNRALDAYSRWLRAEVGPDYALGAIVPDTRSAAAGLPGLWPGFPYRAVGRGYDVFLPMAYSVYRGHGAPFVYGYVRRQVRAIRAGTGRRGVPVHVIGGLAGGLGSAEARATVRASRDGGAMGVSFYNYRSSGPEEWAALRGF
jgi:uncharacterized lipoprotein YddW (UPF0748 family)